MAAQHGEVIKYLDCCSGYSAFTQGAIGLGFECAGYAEIEPFPCAVLGHRYGASRPRYMPDAEADGISAKERKTRLALGKSMAALKDNHFGNRVTNFGDFTQIREDDVGLVRLLVGGTPCQAFSIAGKRLGLDDPRGNLTLEYLALAKRVRASWLAWENVPGFLSHDGGRTMGTFLGLLGELGYGFAYRVLDAQYIRVDGCPRAVPQRRKRLIVVGYSREMGRPEDAGALLDRGGISSLPAAVLLDRESLRGDPAPRRRTGEGVTGTLSARTQGGGGLGTDFDLAGGLVPFGGGNCSGPIDIATAQTAHGNRLDFDSETFVAHALRAEGFDASEDGTGRGTPIIPTIAIQERAGCENLNAGPDGIGVRDDGLAYTLEARTVPQAVAFQTSGNCGAWETGDKTGALDTGTDPNSHIVCFSSKDHGADAGELCPTLRSMGHADIHANGGGQVAVAMPISHDKVEVSDKRRRYVEDLRVLREAVGEDAFEAWGMGVAQRFLAPEVLRSEVHGTGVSGQAGKERKLERDTQPRSKAGAKGAVQALWRAGCAGRSPQGWRPSKQLAQQLGEDLSILPQSGASRAFLLDLREAAQGIGLLRDALATVQEMGRSSGGENQSAHAAWAVRRLTVIECARLMDVPDEFLRIPFRGKPASDGPIYKTLGNSQTRNMMRWLAHGLRTAMDIEDTHRDL